MRIRKMSPPDPTGSRSGYDRIQIRNRTLVHNYCMFLTLCKYFEQLADYLTDWWCSTCCSPSSWTRWASSSPWSSSTGTSGGPAPTPCPTGYGSSSLRHTQQAILKKIPWTYVLSSFDSYAFQRFKRKTLLTKYIKNITRKYKNLWSVLWPHLYIYP